MKKITFPLIVFFTSRLAIFCLAIVFIGLLPFKTHPSFLEAFSQWDGEWYLEIVKNGYWYQGADVQSPVAFFPLYPLLGRVLALIGFSPELALFLVANLACLGFFIVFWLLMKNEFNKKVANIALIYYALSPLSYVFSSLYTESLFLFLACSCFYLLKEKHFLAASLMAGLASATRPFGIILFLPILFLGLKKKKVFFHLFNYLWISSLGIGLFSIYLYFQFGQLAPFLGVQANAWRRPFRWPWQSLDLFQQSIQVIPSGNSLFPILVFDLIIILLFLVLLFFSLRKIDFIYQLYLWPVCFSSLSQPWRPDFFLTTGAMARYFFQMFPLIGLLAQVGQKNKLVHYLVIFIFASLMGPFALAFFHGMWVE